jgi:SAM-dependent methyltransferase
MKFRDTWLSALLKRAVLASSEFAAERGWQLAAYNPALFAFYHVIARDNAPGMIAAIEETFPAAGAYLDVGAGSGAFSAEARRRGKRVVACEHSPFGRAIARMQRVDSRPFDLERQPPADVEQADVALCLEVAEHVPPEMGDQLIEFLTDHAGNIVFSAAHPGQGGTGHINEQWADYWAALFAERGYVAIDAIRPQIWQDGAICWWYRQNILMFGDSQLVNSNPRLLLEAQKTLGTMLSVVHPECFQPLSFQQILSVGSRKIVAAARRKLQMN